jgi:bacterioferritin (cytochrome b1)
MDKALVVRKLNGALERELNEVVRYMHQSFWVKGRHAKKLRAFFREQSQESMGHATLLGEQIVALGGKPVVRILEIYEPKNVSDRALLEECVAHEHAAWAGYLKILPLVQSNPKLKRLISSLVKEEGEHMAEIKKMAKEF